MFVFFFLCLGMALGVKADVQYGKVSPAHTQSVERQAASPARIARSAVASGRLANLPAPGDRPDQSGAASAGLSDFTSYVDAGGAVSIGEIVDLADRHPELFMANPGYNSGGYSLSAKWLKFTVQAPPGEWWLVVLPPNLDDLRFYEPSASGGWIEHRSGDWLPFGHREIAYRGHAFRLRAEGPGPHTCFLRMHTSGTNQLLPRLLSGKEFHETMLVEYVALLGLVGFLFLMAGINLVSYYPLRDRIHLVFVAALLIQAALYLTNGGFTAQLLLPNFPVVTDAAVGFLSFLGFAVFGLFYIEFLGIEPGRRVAYNAYRALQWGGLLAIVTVRTNFFSVVMQTMNFVFIICVLLSVPHVITQWRQAVPGRNQIVGVVIFNLGGLFIHMLAQTGGLPVNLLTLHSAPLSSFGTIALAHLALVARQNLLREERIRAERDAAREREMRVQMEKFIDCVSHEYRNPLAVLETNLYLLTVSQGDSERPGRLLRMRMAVDRLATIFNHTLRASAWGGFRRMESAPVELESLLRSWLRKPGSLWQEFPGGVTLKSDGPVPILADRLLLETVLTNVLTNACNYSDPRGAIGVTLTRDSDHGRITVSNSYLGPVMLDHSTLFERGVRGPNAQGIDGTGMGLFLVRKLVADQRGEVTLDLSRRGYFVLALIFPLEKSARLA